ncbi:MAG: hypothetical protein WAJ92_06915 [Candidatus Acidiferrales bacterium]
MLAQEGEPEVLLPEQSAAKAKQIIQLGIEALGGSAYLGVKDITITGQLSFFGHSGELNGYGKFIDYAIPPGKDRQENLPKRNIIEVYNGDKGWTLDRGGVSEAAASSVSQNVADQKIDIDNILRRRIHEPDMIFRYDGPDVVELKQADWVELVDSDNRTIRIAFAQSTHLPIKKEVELRDPQTQRRTSEKEYYSNYHPIQGVQTPFQIARERNDIKIYQVFFDSVQYNTGISDQIFTRQSLEDRWQQVDKKHKKQKDQKPKTSPTDSDDSSQPQKN